MAMCQSQLRWHMRLKGLSFDSLLYKIQHQERQDEAKRSYFSDLRTCLPVLTLVSPLSLFVCHSERPYECLVSTEDELRVHRESVVGHQYSLPPLEHRQCDERNIFPHFHENVEVFFNLWLD